MQVAELKGKTYDGTPFKGAASVKVGHKNDEVEYDIDTCFSLSQSNMPGVYHGPARSVGAIIGSDNTLDEFVVNEVEFSPKDYI
jgi:hypothetical protein